MFTRSGPRDLGVSHSTTGIRPVGRDLVPAHCAAITSDMNLPNPWIIAVDDEADDIFFLRHAIQKVGFLHRFQPFANSEAARVALTSVAHGDDPAEFPLVCFLDIKMSGMTGFDLLQW